MIQRISIENDRIKVFNESNVEVGEVELYERVKYEDVNTTQRHTVKAKTTTSTVGVGAVGSVIIDKTLEGNPVSVLDASRKMVNTYSNNTEKHFKVIPFSKNKEYMKNEVFAHNMNIYYVNEDNISLQSPTDISGIDMSVGVNVDMYDKFSMNVKSISESIVTYDKMNIVYVFDKGKNSLSGIGTLNTNSISYAVVRGDKVIQVVTGGVGEPNYIITSDASFPELSFEPKTIASTDEKVFILSVDGKLYSSDLNEYSFSLFGEYTGSLISVYKDLILMQNSDGSYTIESMFDKTSKVDFSTQNIVHGLYSGYNVFISYPNNGPQRTIKIDKKFTYLTPSEYYKVNGRSEVYSSSSSLSSSRSIYVSSDALIGESIAITPRNVYIIANSTVYEMNLGSQGISGINDSSSRTESENISYIDGYDGIYYCNGYVYMYSRSSRIIERYNSSTFDNDTLDFSQSINGSGIQSMFAADDSETITVLTDDNTVYVIQLSNGDIISTFSVDGTIHDTEIFKWVKSSILASNIYSTSKAIYEINKESGKKKTDATLVLAGLSSDRFKMIEYNTDLAVYYGDTGKIEVHSRHDTIQRTR